jgi:hypothetical protein
MEKKREVLDGKVFDWFGCAVVFSGELDAQIVYLQTTIM